MGYIGRGLSSGQYRKLDSIASSFDGSTTEFELTVDNTTVTPSSQNCLISINGVVQEPFNAFAVTGSAINFSEAPDTGANFFGVVMGEAAFIAGNTVGQNELASKTVIANYIGSAISGSTAGGFEFDGTISGSSSSTGSFGKIFTGGANQVYSANASQLVIGAPTGNYGLTIAGNGDGNIFFADGTSGASTYAGYIQYNHSSNGMILATGGGGTTALTLDSSQNATFAGTVNVPEYVNHDGDTDTHLRFSAADAIEITAGGVKMVRFLEDDSQDMIVFNEDSADIDFRVESDNDTHALFIEGSSGNVGIGSNSPATTLDVVGNIKASTHVTASTALITGRLTVGEVFTQYVSSSVLIESSGSTKLGDNSTDLHQVTGSMSVLSGSLITRGTAAAQEKISGSAYSTGSFGDLSINQIHSQNHASTGRPGLTQIQGGTDWAVGIGTAAPSTGFYPQFNLHGVQPSILFQDSAAASSDFLTIMHDANVTKFWSNNDSSAFIHFGNASNVGGTSLSNKISFDLYNGRVGIGTDNPITTLDINSASHNVTQFALSVDGGQLLEMGTEGSSNYSWIKAAHSAYSLSLGGGDSVGHLFIKNDGKVGIGTTSPESQLHITGSGEVQVFIDSQGGNNPGVRLLEGGANKWTIGHNNANDNLFFYDFASSTTVLELDAGKISGSSVSTGSFGKVHVADNIGIGTTAGTAFPLAITQGGAESCIYIDNNSNAGNAGISYNGTGARGPFIYAITDQGSNQGDPLVWLQADNTGFDKEVLYVHNDGTAAAIVTTGAGNTSVGIGTTSPAGSDGSARTLQLGTNLVIQDVVGTQTMFANNAHYDGTWKQVAAGENPVAMRFGAGGQINFHIANIGSAGGTLSTWDTTDIKMSMVSGSSGTNVGIGTNNPGEKLDIQHAGNVYIKMKSTSAGESAVKFFDETHGEQFRVGIGASNGSYPLDGLITSAAEDIRISTGGLGGGSHRGIFIHGTTGAVGMGSVPTGSIGAGRLIVNNSGQNSYITMEGGAPTLGFVDTEAGHQNFGWQIDSSVMHLTTTGMNDMSSQSRLFSIKSDGKVGIGTTAPNVTLDVRTTQGVEINSATGGGAPRFWLYDYKNDNESANIQFHKSKHGTIGSHAVVADGTDLGRIAFYASDGNSWEASAEIRAEIDGTPGDGDVPGRLSFSTTPDGSGATVERMRITNAGLVGIGTNAPGNNVEIYDTGDVGLILNTAHASDWAGVQFERAGTMKWKIYIGGAHADNLTIADAGLNDGMYMSQDASDWSDISDERLKTSITPIENAIDKLNAFQAVNFKWKYGSEEKRTKNNIGFLAQEVNEVVPEAVDSYDNEDFKIVDHPENEGQKQAQGSWGIRKAVLIPVLVKAVQELSAEVTELKKEIEELKK